MAETPNSDGPDETRARGASKLAILVAFIAGAFAAWIIIQANLF